MHGQKRAESSEASDDFLESEEEEAIIEELPPSQSDGTDADASQLSITQAVGETTTSPMSQVTTSMSSADEVSVSALTEPEQYSVMYSEADTELVSPPLMRQPEARPTERPPVGGRRIYLLRNAERMDRLYPGWLELSARRSGQFKPYDLNQPMRVVNRHGGYMAYKRDCPITEMGSITSMMIGRSMQAKNLIPEQIIVSPAFRCIQTGQSLLKMMTSTALNMCREPGLFEYLGWYGDSIPTWMTIDELANNGYKVAKFYAPVMSEAKLLAHKEETALQFYERCADVTRKLLERNQGAKSLLLILHSLTMDAVSSMLLGRKPTELPRAELEQMGRYYPYCAFIAFEEQNDKSWQVISDAMPSITCDGFSNHVDQVFFHRK